MREISLEDLYALGLTNTQIAGITGLTQGAVRGRINRLGLRSNSRKARSFRDMIASMKSEDRLEYAILIADELLKVPDEPTITGIGLSRKERQVLAYLMNSDGQPRRKESIMAAVYTDRYCGDEVPDVRIIDVFVHKIRKKLPADFGSIETVWGVGYRFISNKTDVTNA